MFSKIHGLGCFNLVSERGWPASSDMAGCFSKMGFVGKGEKEPMVYVSREGCVV